MHRIDTPTAQKDKFGAGKNGFTKGDPQTGTPATEIDETILDAVQEEICAVIEGSGTALSKDDKSQLLKSINKLIDRKTKYGCPLIGELIEWPHQLMPNEIFTDIGMTFIPYMGQPFDKEAFHILAKLHPSGRLPIDMRSEFVRGADLGRGVDTKSIIMGASPSSIKSHTHRLNVGINIDENRNLLGGLITDPVAVKSFTQSTVVDYSSNRVESVGGNDTYPRYVGWNYITRSS